MWLDVVDLNAFYRARLGAVAQGMVAAGVRKIWPDLSGLAVAGVGYATPYLSMYLEEAERVVAVMPAYQGVTHWPRGKPNLVALADETALPFADMSLDRLLVVHAIEHTEHLRPMLRECWRVLNGGGRMMMVVPARRGLWARSERSPFGHGKPFTQAQIKKLMKDTMFEPTRMARALYVPPLEWPLMLGSATAWERAGSRWFPRFGGVHIVEASKQVYAAGAARKVPARRPLVVLPSPVPSGAAAGRGAARNVK